MNVMDFKIFSSLRNIWLDGCFKYVNMNLNM